MNITHKLYACGMPGVGIVKPIGNHAITLDEFYQIYGIYEKYDGLELMAFSKEEQKERHTVRHYVHTPDANARRGLLEMLEKDGYQIEDDGVTTRQLIIESGLPVMINETDKNFNIVHNTADESALAKSDRIQDLDVFYVYYKWSECTYEEYYAVVLKLFVRGSRYNEEEARKIMEGEEDVIRTAVSLGGDCDTLTCIAGGMAEAFYGMPDSIKEEVRIRLTADLLMVCERFTGEIRN